VNLQNRLLRVIYSRTHDVLVGSDVRGRIHKMSRDLEVLASSPVTTYDRPINAICLTDRYVFTKDRFGAIGKWDLATLRPLDFYDGRMVHDRRALLPDEEPSPSPNRAIAVLNGRLYTPNGYNQIVVIDVETFELLDVRPSPSETFVDCICVDHPEVHALSDVDGTLFIGNLERNEFPIRRQIDTNVVHGVAYDPRHDRFWTTQDGGLGDDRYVRTGVTTIEKDGTGFREHKVSHEDNEFIAMTPDGLHVVSGGFNGRIAVFDNTGRDFFLKRLIGPLEFQVISAAVVAADNIYALLQTGDVIGLDGEGRERCRTRYDSRCVWTLEPHPGDETLVYAGTDQGCALLRYAPGRFGTVHVEQLAHHRHGFGIVKDVRPFPDGAYVGISRKGDVFRARQTGAVVWQRDVAGVPRGVALSPDFDRCLVSTDEGTVWELDARTGAVVDRIPVGSPSYACVYAPDGRRVVTADGGQQVHVYAADSHEILGSIRGFTYRLKRIGLGSNGEVFVTGPDGMFELDLEKYAVRRTFGDYLVSTKENGVLCNGFLHVGGYGYQIGTYRHETGEIVDLQENLPDFTKAFAARVPEDGVPILLVGGRGGFVNAYRVYNGVPVKVREFYVT
jgi:WD40 repeat protein